jgi:hypothetical protein
MSLSPPPVSRPMPALAPPTSNILPPLPSLFVVSFLNPRRWKIVVIRPKQTQLQLANLPPPAPPPTTSIRIPPPLVASSPPSGAQLIAPHAPPATLGLSSMPSHRPQVHLCSNVFALSIRKKKCVHDVPFPHFVLPSVGLFLACAVVAAAHALRRRAAVAHGERCTAAAAAAATIRTDDDVSDAADRTATDVRAETM